MNDLTDKEILDSTVGGQIVREMTATTFYSWLATKMNGVPSYRADTQELLRAVSNPPMSRSMPDEEKVRLIRKLLALGVEI